jgi:3-deoxy-manno-octulosonate cytidylyltransferase (CMP-KDO synthetase)|tara:strand:+ start:556 stop:1293 length:738 start_codon:yes stop_codon:yes gene_type:complete
MSKTVILIPSRLSAKRLPRKPLLKINGISIISHVVKKAKEADIGDVYVATEDKEIMEDINLNGGKAILTSKRHKTGSDRIFECFEKLDLIDIDYIINLQGDEPNIDLNDLRHFNKLININKPEIGTMAAEIDNKSKLKDENVVKVITESKITNENFPIALDFKRRANDQIINIYHHIGIYAFKPEILKKIIKLKQTKNEIKNRLEQLRAMENRIKINVALAKFSPIGIDTMEDYLALKKLLEYNS